MKRRTIMRNPMSNLAGWRQLAMASLLTTGLLWATNKGPDAGNYTATDNTVYSFIDPFGSGGAPSVLAGAEVGGAALTLPFSFQFYGQSYTMICVSPNGLAYFVNSGSTFCASQSQLGDFANTDLTSTAVPGDLPAIAPYWSDLSFAPAGAGAVYYQTVGTSPNRQFVIEWYNAASPTGAFSPVTFEAILNETSNNIVFQYQTVNLGKGNAQSNGGQATVGIRNTGGNTNNQALQWSFDSAVLSNSYAILFTAPSATATSVNIIATSPSGIPVTIDNASTPTPTPATVYWLPESNHTLSVTASQDNGTGTQTTFASWSTGPTTTQISVSAPPTGTTYTANFNTKYELFTTATPSNEGTVNISGTGPYYDANSQVTVTAQGTGNYVFKGFSGDLTGTTNPQMITMNGVKHVTATFGVPYACSVSNGNSATVSDVQAIVNQALGKAAPLNDVNNDKVVNVTDVQIVINAVLNFGCTV